MHLTNRLSQPQKIVIVVALGMAFGAAGTYLVGLGNTPAGGWYAYATPSQASFSGAGWIWGAGGIAATGLHRWQRLLIWLALIGLWALLSVRVLRPSPERAPDN